MAIHPYIPPKQPRMIIMAYYNPHITGWYFIPYNSLNNQVTQVFFIAPTPGSSQVSSTSLVGGFNPFWRILVKMGIFPNFRGENKQKNWNQHLVPFRIPVPVSHWPTASQWSPLHPPHLWHARRPVVNSAPTSQPAQRWWPKMGESQGSFWRGGVVNIKNIIYHIECITHKHKAQYTKNEK